LLQELGLGPTSETWLLLDGESPRGARWVFGVLALLAGFAAFAAFGLFRLLRRAG
jgi:hypothetical protein